MNNDGCTNYVLENFPFLEDDFDSLTDYQLFCKGFEYLDETKADINDIPDVSKFITKDVKNLTFYYDKDTINLLLGEKVNVDDLSRVATTGDYDDLTNKPDLSNFITKDVDDLTYYTKTSDLSTVATSGNYDDLTNKPTIPDVSNFITKDVDDLTYYTNNTDLTSLLSNKEDVIEYGSNSKGNYMKFSNGIMFQWGNLEVTDQAINSAYGSTGLYTGSRIIELPSSFVALAYDYFSRSTGTTTKISWNAFGKWK